MLDKSPSEPIDPLLWFPAIVGASSIHTVTTAFGNNPSLTKDTDTRASLGTIKPTSGADETIGMAPATSSSASIRREKLGRGRRPPEIYPALEMDIPPA